MRSDPEMLWLRVVVRGERLEQEGARLDLGVFGRGLRRART